ncbi:stonin-2 [Latimeria chalumnae]|uniref:stonin-2 n=1 Tax=Latimeria chalumnae TaxID=7897 RepID=UPI00313CC033
MEGGRKRREEGRETDGEREMAEKDGTLGSASPVTDVSQQSSTRPDPEGVPCFLFPNSAVNRTHLHLCAGPDEIAVVETQLTLAPDLTPTPGSPWVQFEGVTVTDSPSTFSQLTGSLGQEGSPYSFWQSRPNSESNWTVSDDSSTPSVTPSYVDLQLVETEEVLSTDIGALDSTDNSSFFQEDEELEMETLGWQSSATQMNGNSETTSARFPSWVTFDEDEFNVFSPPPQSPFQQDTARAAPAQNANSNIINSLPKRPRPKSILMTLSQERKHIPLARSKSSPGNRMPMKTTNPFLDESLEDVQPSPINPFSSFFDKQENSLVNLKETQNGSHLETSQQNSVGGPPFLDGQVNSLSFELFSFEESSSRTSQLHALEQLKQIHIVDPDQPCSPTFPDDPISSEEPDGPLLEFAQPQPKDGWPMMLRIPEKKNIMSSRHWGPICVKLTDMGLLRLFYEKGMEKPFREFQLNLSHEVSEPKLQNFDENGQIHTIRIDHVSYKEKRKYQPKPAVVHVPVREQLIKLGTTDYEDFLSFLHTAQDVLMRLPIMKIKMGSTYLDEELTIDVRDEFHGTAAQGDSKILQYSVATHVHVLAFLSGSPECRLGLNDVLVKGNEVVSRHDIMPTTTSKWIQLRNCIFHRSVDEEAFQKSRVISFHPPDASRFELMRFHNAFADKALPFSLKTAASVNGAEVALQSWLVMSSGFSSNRDPLAQIPCENVMVRFPVPTEWIKHFRRESVMGEKSLKAKVNKGASFGSTSVSGSEPVMRVTLGAAKYEHAFKAVVWRIGRLPDKNSAFGHPHCFYCHLELGSDREVPSSFVRYVDVEFDMPSASASRAAVRSVSVAERSDIRKWVNYSAHYRYQVEMEQKKTPNPDSNRLETDQPNQCSPQ